MFTELYIEALLADENLADQVWELWNAGVITDELSAWAWWLTGSDRSGHRQISYNRSNCKES